MSIYNFNELENLLRSLKVSIEEHLYWLKNFHWEEGSYNHPKVTEHSYGDVNGSLGGSDKELYLRLLWEEARKEKRFEEIKSILREYPELEIKD